MLQLLTTHATTAARNALALAFGDGVEPPHATPSTVLHDEPHQVLRRFSGPTPSAASSTTAASDATSPTSPVLLVPPLAAPANCFDLRKGQSLAEFLVETGRRTYLVDYGEIGFADRRMGMEDWIDEIIPNAIRRASAAENGAAVDVVAWSIGGTLSLLTAAAHQELPIRSITAVGSPIDYSKLPMLQPWRRVGKLTGGEPVTSVYRLAGGIPGALVRTGFSVTALDRTLTKPAFIARNLLDTDALGKMQAVDRFMSAMPAYPGRFYGQVNGRLIIHNDLARGTLKLGARRIHLADVTVPVLLVAGTTDVITTEAAARAGTSVLTGTSVRFTTTRGSHLGILTGPDARETTWRYLDEFLTAQDPPARQAPGSTHGATAPDSSTRVAAR
ncbi:alpha/beta hydrolase [Haloechinothrix halophila]|uniref:alpha/beta hydrolase n=1 Tax=Haloechinothrix halophila TaxID=1069073 RepID=UPI0003F8EAC1|nr:alpha/beta hydrolase [Haloechinothrix halophila]